jgi:hypothetical protein
MCLESQVEMGGGGACDCYQNCYSKSSNSTWEWMISGLRKRSIYCTNVSDLGEYISYKCVSVLRYGGSCIEMVFFYLGASILTDGDKLILSFSYK